LLRQGVSGSGHRSFRLRFTLSRHNGLPEVACFVEKLAEVVAHRRQAASAAAAM
jgi:hypothetical protein